ncbi:hypothetical protein SARC_12885 [Sphaeroforma arctica JP610]|uniref:Uncharacterized protein n=1 Tax=Sphaeroforma arctica JP610 TaxID=667725 RepID=A0A0L0FEW1_9EUKA|nr:hypothetical protein SARC_12885 [Sphaeroforma arctica JP610]KNC74573.1 hypothetical protein SARC_12885 [Sphaeroforma arctica JP610]|eukprot:XP_014148475.1 hypothetical protein SARC_12885 [Sphaeroforma arctica JP610]
MWQLRLPRLLLGVFAAITIECSDVVLDLGGKTLRQSKAFNTQQRFFSCIEISRAPFITGQGLNDFGENDELVSNVGIRVGKLGLSSHHGIHGNTMDNVEILNVHITQFEVAGISLNGAKRLLISNCIVGNFVANVPTSSAYSQARFLHPVLKQLVLEDSERCVTIRGQPIPIKTSYASLVTEMNATFVEVMTDKPVTSDVFRNRNQSMLSDGNVYGILVNRKGVAVGDFVGDLDFESQDAAHSVMIQNTRVERINSEAIEIRGLQYMEKARAVAAGLEANEGYGNAGVLVDSVGAIFDFVRVCDPVSRAYQGHVLSNAQLAVGKYEAEPKRSYIPEEVLQWATCGGTWTHDDTFSLTTGGDSMGHTMKGNLGVSMSGVACVGVEATVVVPATHGRARFDVGLLLERLIELGKGFSTCIHFCKWPRLSASLAWQMARVSMRASMFWRLRARRGILVSMSSGHGGQCK